MLAPTEFVWHPMIPELACIDLKLSLQFYVDVVGFRVVYDRPESDFSFIALGGVQFMLEQVNLDRLRDHWITAELTRPFGRGVNFQIEVEDVMALNERLLQANVGLYESVAEACYRVGDRERRQLQLLVQDPDGYMLRFCQILS